MGVGLDCPSLTDLVSYLIPSSASWHLFTSCSLRREVFPLQTSQKAMSLKTLKKKEICLVTPALKCMIFISHFSLLGSSWSRGLNFIQKIEPSPSPTLNLPWQPQPPKAQQHSVCNGKSPTLALILSVHHGSCGPGGPFSGGIRHECSCVLHSPLI